MKEVTKLVEQRLELFKNKSVNNYFLFLFRGWKSSMDISKQFHTKNHFPLSKGEKPTKENTSKRLYKKKPIPTVSKYISALHKLGWVNLRKKKDGRITQYKANLKPYFEYLKIRGMDLGKKDKRKVKKRLTSFLEDYLGYAEIYSNDKFLDKCNKYVKKWLQDELVSYRSFGTVSLEKDSYYIQTLRFATDFLDSITLENLYKSIQYKMGIEQGIFEEKAKELMIIFDILEGRI